MLAKLSSSDISLYHAIDGTLEENQPVCKTLGMTSQVLLVLLAQSDVALPLEATPDPADSSSEAVSTPLIPYS